MSLTSNVNAYGNWWDNDIARNILTKKYFHDEELKVAETNFKKAFDMFVDRVSGIFPDETIKGFVKLSLYNGDFIPAGRTLYAAGAKGKFQATTSNCYILPSPKDNIESIFDVAKKMARIFSYGGGTGCSVSNLRPKNAKVNNSAKTSTGSISFMELYDIVTKVIGNNGRRAALLLCIDCDHPDVEEFLTIKQDNTSIQGANLSIKFTDKFMQAVRDNKTFPLYFKVEATGEEIKKEINAHDFFMKFCEIQRDWSEPAALYIDRIRSWNMLSGYPKEEYFIETTNP